MRGFGGRSKVGRVDRRVRDEHEALSGRRATRVVDERGELMLQSGAWTVKAVDQDDGVDGPRLRLDQRGQHAHVTRTPRTESNVSHVRGRAMALFEHSLDLLEDLSEKARARE